MLPRPSWSRVMQVPRNQPPQVRQRQGYALIGHRGARFVGNMSRAKGTVSHTGRKVKASKKEMTKAVLDAEMDAIKADNETGITASNQQVKKDKDEDEGIISSIEEATGSNERNEEENGVTESWMLEAEDEYSDLDNDDLEALLRDEDDDE